MYWVAAKSVNDDKVSSEWYDNYDEASQAYDEAIADEGFHMVKLCGPTGVVLRRWAASPSLYHFEFMQ